MRSRQTCDAISRTRDLRCFEVLAARHAACGYDLAARDARGIREAETDVDKEWIAEFACRAVAWEARADQLLNEARDDAKRFRRPPSLIDFLEYADDAVDELEEAASRIDLFALFLRRASPWASCAGSLTWRWLGAGASSNPSSAPPPSRAWMCAMTSTTSCRPWSASLRSSIRPTSKFACCAAGSSPTLCEGSSRAVPAPPPCAGAGDRHGRLRPRWSGVARVPYGGGHPVSRRTVRHNALEVYRIPDAMGLTSCRPRIWSARRRTT